MKSKVLRWVPYIGMLVLAVAIGTPAQAPTPVHFSGLINDYSPATVSGKVVGPWEMRGTWSLDLKGHSGLANFSAALTMELSDYTRNASNIDITSGAGSRTQHTHHITMNDAVISYDTSTCPKNSPATTNPGFMVTGQAGQVIVTGNGGPAPFETNPPSSTLQVCVNGGSDVAFSNVTLVFGGPATTHFGLQAIHGVVRKAKSDSDNEQH